MQVFSMCGESNWWTDVSKLIDLYELNLTLHEIKSMSKNSFKNIVKKCIRKYAFNKLQEECRSKKTTSNIQYSCLKLQKYMENLYPGQSKILFQCRSRTLDIKDHRAYKFGDRKCRGCQNNDETLEHIINCDGTNGEHKERLRVDFDKSAEWNDTDIAQCVQRIRKFLDDNA